jgi:hypothetical protein
MNSSIPFWRSSLRTCVSIKSSIELGLRPKNVAYKIKILSFKYIYKKSNKKMDVVNKNPTIHFTCKTNETESPMCVVMKLWTSRFWFSTLDCDRRVKSADTMCWIYSTHIASKTHDVLKSF